MFKWLKDRRYNEVLYTLRTITHEIELMNAKIENMEMRIRGIKTEVTKSSNKPSKDPDIDYHKELMDAFGGVLPFELSEKYKRDDPFYK